MHEEPGPITETGGICLKQTNSPGIARVEVTEKEAKALLPWDRFVRLKAAAELIEANSLPCSVLDVGGYDGALAFFLSYPVDLLDPSTTGGTATSINASDHSYDVVAAVDVLEHIKPNERRGVLLECARIASKLLVLNYPCRESLPAQQLMLQLTNNAFVKEHVEWELPDSDWVMSELTALGFECQLVCHTNAGIWLGQYLVQNLLPDVAPLLNSALIADHSTEPFSIPLYHLVVAKRPG